MDFLESEYFEAKSDIFIYIIGPEIVKHQVYFPKEESIFATFHEAYMEYKRRFGNDLLDSPNNPHVSNREYVHKFVIKKGEFYFRRGFYIYPGSADYVETIYDIENYGKNGSK